MLQNNGTGFTSRSFYIKLIVINILGLIIGLIYMITEKKDLTVSFADGYFIVAIVLYAIAVIGFWSDRKARKDEYIEAYKKRKSEKKDKNPPYIIQPVPYFILGSIALAISLIFCCF